MAELNEISLIAGRGHEPYHKILDCIVPFGIFQD